jgi:hypothetical protein
VDEERREYVKFTRERETPAAQEVGVFVIYLQTAPPVKTPAMPKNSRTHIQSFDLNERRKWF